MHRTFFLPLLTATLVSMSFANAATKLSTWSEKVHKKWWTEYSSPQLFLGEKQSIKKQLVSAYKRVGTTTALNNKDFAAWTEHLLWLSLFPENWANDPFFKTEKAQQAFKKIAQNQHLKRLFISNLSPQDDHHAALKILCEIYHLHGDTMEDFGSLAVAISIVFDQPFPEGWPHSFVKKKDLPIGKETPIERFLFYVKASRENQLMLDIKKMYPQDLKFMVDTPIELDELRRLRKVKIKSTRQFEQLFKQIRYNEPRLRSGKYIWNQGPYTMAAINKQGGLCVDQAYFTIHTAKAKGVPSILFMGQGNSGAHAWVGAMKSTNSWFFDYAKFSNEKYPVGQSFDPQTWKKLTDSECKFIEKRNERDDIKARTYLLWAHLNKDSQLHLESIRAAKKISPFLLITWEMEASALESAPIPEQVKFWKDWISSFQKQSDLRFRGQKRLLGLYESAKLTRDYDKLLTEIVRTNKSKREDLVVQIAAEQVFMKIENSKWKEANTTFTKAMQILRSKAGGSLFYELVQPYVRSCLDAGKKDYAEAAINRALKTFTPQKGSILDKDVNNLKKLIKG